MKFNSMQKKMYRASYFAFSLGGANNEVKSYFFHSFIYFAGGTNPGGMTVYTDTAVQIGAQFASMIDRKGNLLFPSLLNDTGGVFEVTSCLPMLNVFGNKEGYRIGLQRVSGNV